MSAEAEAKLLVVDIAGPLRLGENVKAVLGRVARVTGLGERRVRGIWNGEARAIRAEEMDRLRRAALDAKAREETDREFRTLVSRLAAVEAALGLPAQDEDGGRHHALVRQARPVDRALDQGRGA